MVLDRAELARALSALVGGEASPSELTARLCAACLRVLPVDGVGLSLAGGEHLGGLTALGASDEVQAALAQLQFDLGEGPVASALAERKPVLVPDLAAPEVRSRWPVFTEKAQASGVRALFAFPLQLGSIRIG
jgi:GAF domain-containing protein